MLFNSYIFVLLFLPLSVIGYFLFNKFKKYKAAKFYLLCMSLWFYAFFNIKYFPVILFSIILNYAINIGLQTSLNQWFRKALLGFALFMNLGVLFYYKYFDFFIQNINDLFSLDWNLNHLILPLGISFFTFQQISYIIDSYRKEVPNYQFLDYALFVTFFPQLIAGPIVTHDEIVPQFADRSKKKFCFESFSKGLMAFSMGLGKKVLIADTFGNAVNFGYSNISSLNSADAIIVMLAYTIQIYFDFSGYCDMATGIGLMFRIEIPMNFNSPYKSFTITEFWKRWHITLTRFFTKYIYIPLGGSHKGRLRTYVNIFLVFLVSGFWHGANWTFIFWGVIHGIFNIITRIFSKTFKKLHPAFNWMLTFAFINLSWIYFRASSIGEANTIIKKIFSFNFGKIKKEIVNCFNLDELILIFNSFPIDILSIFPYFFMAAFLFISFFIIMLAKNTNERVLEFKPSIWNGSIVTLLLFWSIISFSGVSTFLYFNF